MFRVKQDKKSDIESNYSYWQTLYLAFYSSRLYIEVIKHWRGFALGYFFLLMLLISIPWSLFYNNLFADYIDDNLIYPIKNMPLIMIQNGEASIDKPVPYVINNKAGQPAIVIDTSTESNEFPPMKPTVSMFITKHKMLFRATIDQLHSMFPWSKSLPLPEPDNKNAEYIFDKNDNEVFSGRDWVENGSLHNMKTYSLILVYPVVLGVMLGLYCVLSFILASVGRIISVVILKFKITFKQSFRLIWVASTAPLLFINVQQLLNIPLPFYGPIYCILVMLFFCYGILAVKHERHYLVQR